MIQAMCNCIFQLWIQFQTQNYHTLRMTIVWIKYSRMKLTYNAVRREMSKCKTESAFFPSFVCGCIQKLVMNFEIGFMGCCPTISTHLILVGFQRIYMWCYAQLMHSTNKLPKKFFIYEKAKEKNSHWKWICVFNKKCHNVKKKTVTNLFRVVFFYWRVKFFLGRSEKLDCFAKVHTKWIIENIWCY